jgi:hypothetical protein
VPVPFEQKVLDQTLKEVLSLPDLHELGDNGVRYASQNDVTGLHDKAVDIIEDVARRRSLR